MTSNFHICLYIFKGNSFSVALIEVYFKFQPPRNEILPKQKTLRYLWNQLHFVIDSAKRAKRCTSKKIPTSSLFKRVSGKQTRLFMQFSLTGFSECELCIHLQENTGKTQTKTTILGFNFAKWMKWCFLLRLFSF